MRQFVALLLIFCSFALSGQSVKRVVVTYPKSEYIKEVYYVLKSDGNIKQGNYYSFYKGELTIKGLKERNLDSNLRGVNEKGFYENDLKNGGWIVYGQPIKNSQKYIYNAKLEEGQFVLDQKKGIWKTYVEDGKIIKQFDFDNQAELPPLIKVSLKYPAAARKNRVQGIVKIKVTYNNCNPVNYEIIQDIGYGCGNAAIEYLKEKEVLEEKYGVSRSNCDEVIEARFKLDE